jgi:hypothetical protein
MQTKSESNDLAAILKGLISGAVEGPVVIKTISGATLLGYDPITIGPDFVMFASGSTPAHRQIVIRMVSIESITV